MVTLKLNIYLSNLGCYLLQKKMEGVGVLMTCPMLTYLEEELEKRFTLFRFWESHSETQFLEQKSDSILAVVGNASFNADSDLIDALPHLQIVASYSVGVDKIDLNKCEKRGIRVTNTPDVLTEDVADTAIGLILATLRKICACDGFVRNGSWKNGDFELTTKVRELGFLILCDNFMRIFYYFEGRYSSPCLFIIP